MSIDSLAGKQNRDGGWPYVRGKSWTEPTVYAVMSLLAAGERDRAARGLEWLRRSQRQDGGWPPQDGVDESNWTTALVALLPPEQLGPGLHRGAVEWLMATTGHESSWQYRVREWLLGLRRPAALGFAGWPWIPGAAAWVGPTSVAVLALQKQLLRRPSPAIRERVESGRKFLLVRACQEGGWNHGSVRDLAYESKPYPETTGMALAALRGVRTPLVPRSVAIAQRFLDECRSADAQNWLRLGLAAQGELPAGYCRPSNISCRTIPEAALDLLLANPAAGHPFFWS